MRLIVVLAAASAVVVGAAGAFSLASSSSDPAEQAVACPKGSLRTVYHGREKCLSEGPRMRIYRALVRLRKRGVPQRRAYRLLSKRYGVSVGALQKIAREGEAKHWAPGRLPGSAPPVLPKDGSTTATALHSTVLCSETQAAQGIAQLSWTPAAERGSEQRIDVTVFRGGFETGQFDSTGALPPELSSLEWDRVIPQAGHLWRVLTRQKGGWVSSAPASFVGPVCGRGDLAPRG